MVRKTNVLLGVLFLCLGLSIVPINDALAKFLSSDLNIFEIIWARFFGHFMFLVPLAYFINGKESFINKETGPQIVRGLMIFAGTAFFYFAIAHIPLANALSLLLIAPIIVVFLSSQFLNEKINIIYPNNEQYIFYLPKLPPEWWNKKLYGELNELLYYWN